MSRKPKIKAWKPITSALSPDEMLLKIESAISTTYNHTGIISYQEIYNCGYGLVHAKKGEELYILVTKLIHAHTSSLCRISTTDTDLLQKVHDLWSVSRESLDYISRIMLYVETTYVKEASLSNFYDFGTVLFKNQIYLESGLGPKVSGLLLAEVMKDKLCVVFDKIVVKSVVDMLIQMGIGSNAVYREVFEESFISSSRDFYKEEAGRLIGQCSTTEYLKNIERRLQQEIKLCMETIDVSSRDKILNVIDECFVVSFYLQIVGDGNLSSMLKTDDYSSMKLLYTIFLRTPKLLKSISDSLSNYIESSVNSILQDQENMKKPTNTITLLLELIYKLNAANEIGFSRDKMLEFTIKRSLESSLNISHRIAVYLSIYIDNYFKKSIKFLSDVEIEAEIIRLLNLFILLKDKDVFESKHKEFLALRLLENKSLNLDAERILIKYLKQECGLQYVAKLEGMLNDISISEPTQFSESFTVRVLTTSFWPQEKFFQISLPPELALECSGFSASYLSDHTGRRLVWRYEYGICHIKAVLGQPARSYELIGSIYQACILLSFNATDSMGLSDLLQSLQGTPAELKKHVLGLVKAKILNKTSKGRTLNSEDVVSVNTGYLGKLNRVQIEVVSAEAENEKAKTNVNVTDERKYVIEAGVVRIMKARRTLEHRDLVTEVLKLTQQRFNPDIKMIKDRIESLIEKEILKRDELTPSLYHYLA